MLTILGSSVLAGKRIQILPSRKKASELVGPKGLRDTDLKPERTLFEDGFRIFFHFLHSAGTCRKHKANIYTQWRGGTAPIVRSELNVDGPSERTVIKGVFSLLFPKGRS